MTHYTCHAIYTDVPTIPAGATHRWATGEWTNPGPYGQATPIPKPCGMSFEARDRAHAVEIVGRWWWDCAAGDRRFHDAVITGGGETWGWGGTGPSGGPPTLDEVMRIVNAGSARHRQGSVSE